MEQLLQRLRELEASLRTEVFGEGDYYNGYEAGRTGAADQLQELLNEVSSS